MLQELTAAAPEALRRRYKVVRRDSGADVPGLILSACVITGSCLMLTPVAGESVQIQHDFGPDGLRIIPAKR